MVSLKKFAFFKTVDDGEKIAGELRAGKKQYDMVMESLGVSQCRAYVQKIEGKEYLFHFFESEGDVSFEGHPARHVYEFKLHEGDDLTGLDARGIIIGVADGMLDEYVRLHDEQPQIIHDLCYQNGFRKSSIFAFAIAPERYYLLQFVEYKGKEDPRLYEDPTYQEWLRVTGECQKPLPGEQFWKDMTLVYQYKKKSRGGKI